LLPFSSEYLSSSPLIITEYEYITTEFQCVISSLALKTDPKLRIFGKKIAEDKI
jgi:hypothetical protein